MRKKRVMIAELPTWSEEKKQWKVVVRSEGVKGKCEVYFNEEREALEYFELVNTKK